MDNTPNKNSINFVVKALTFGGLLMIAIGIILYVYDMKMIGVILVIFGSIEGIVMPKVIKKILNKRSRR